MNSDAIYTAARDRYWQWGVDAEAAMERLKSVPISIQCWQGDDVRGFERVVNELSGDVQPTGNYPGRARNFDELTRDFELAISLIPGKKRMNLHASYAVFEGGEQVDRDKLSPVHFRKWAEWSRKNGIALDFNPTFFAHPLAADQTLSSPDKRVRFFWINHGIACRRIAQYFADNQGSPCLCNIWAPDGFKDKAADRLGPRLRFMNSVQRIISERLPGVIDSLESKVFGVGREAYTVCTHEFCMGFCATRRTIYPLLDSGHFHPTESVADKIPSLLTSFDRVALHISRGERWDSDHVPRFNDELREIALEIVRCDAFDKVLIGMDFFDASINRIAAWVIGVRNLQKALLSALLTPSDALAKLQNKGNFTRLLMMQEEIKTLPFGAVWERYCRNQGVPEDERWFEQVTAYEQTVLSQRS